MRRILLVVAVAVWVGCSMKTEAERQREHEVTGDVLFESYQVDMTWGYQLSGLYIEKDGSVWTYAQSGTPWYPEHLKPNELFARDLVTKHKDARQVGQVDPVQLRDMAQMIKPAARGPIAHAAGSNFGDGGLDVGYLYDPETSIYYEVILAGRGNRVATNRAPEAQILRDYLQHVKQLVQPDAP